MAKQTDTGGKNFKGDITLEELTANTILELDSDKTIAGSRLISDSASGNASDVLDRTGVEAVAGGAAPAGHKATHENGGSDEISVAGLNGELADAQTPKTHASTHENGGSDEISVAGLSGTLADAQTPTTHASTHQNGGTDEISVAGLSGELADAQPVKTHDLSGSDHNSTTLANLNSKISDATLDANTDTRPPATHNNGAHTVTYIEANGVTYENLDTNGDIGTTAGTVAAGDDSRFAAVTGGLNDDDAFYISHTLSDTTDGGATTATTWTVCPFNVEEHDTLTVTLTSNTFVLPAGDYVVDGYHHIYASGRAQLRLRNTTGSTTLELGGGVGGSSQGVNVRLDGRFTVAASQTLQVEYYVGTANATNGLGLNVSSGESEVYGYMKFYKVG